MPQTVIGKAPRFTERMDKIRIDENSPGPATAGPEVYTSFEQKHKGQAAFRLQRHTIDQGKRNRFDEAKKLGIRGQESGQYGT